MTITVVAAIDSLLGGSDSARAVALSLGVDEFFSYSTPSASFGFGARLGSKVAKKEIPLLNMLAKSLPEQLSMISMVLSALAKEVQNVVLDPTMPVDSFELRGAKQVVRVVNVGEDDPESIDRFAAVAQELEDL